MKKIVMLLFSTLLMSGGIYAEDHVMAAARTNRSSVQTPKVLQLSLQEAQNHAVESNRSLKNASLAVQEAYAQRWQTIASMLPQVDGSYAYSNYCGYSATLSMGGMEVPVSMPNVGALGVTASMGLNGQGIVGALLNNIAIDMKKIALEQEHPTTIKKEHLREYLGLPTNSHDLQKGNEAPGVVTGLAWTSMGGEILFIESSVSKGKGILTMTGNLGDVMKESAQIAYQYIKAHPHLTGLPYDEFVEKDIHVHVPEGAVPKDGPSAGITMVTAMVSALTGRRIKASLAMTGEITLSGRVLPVGGIKEKMLAAHRYGVKTILLPHRNMQDLEEIPENVRAEMKFIPVKHMDEVLKLALEDKDGK